MVLMEKTDELSVAAHLDDVGVYPDVKPQPDKNNQQMSETRKVELTRRMFASRVRQHPYLQPKRSKRSPQTPYGRGHSCPDGGKASSRSPQDLRPWTFHGSWGQGDWETWGEVY